MEENLTSALQNCERPLQEGPKSEGSFTLVTCKIVKEEEVRIEVSECLFLERFSSNVGVFTIERVLHKLLQLLQSESFLESSSHWSVYGACNQFFGAGKRIKLNDVYDMNLGCAFGFSGSALKELNMSDTQEGMSSTASEGNISWKGTKEDTSMNFTI